MIRTSKYNWQLPEPNAGKLLLPKPNLQGRISVEAALAGRRSVRTYSKEFLNLKEISQLAWAAQGLTDKEGKRTAPSAGALYPLEIYIVSGKVTSLPAGVYHYQPADHSLNLILAGDRRRLLSTAALLQASVYKSSAVMVIAADFDRTTVKYGSRGIRYVYAEAGHAAQNVYLQSVSLQLGTVIIGAFHGGLVKKILHLPQKEKPLFLMPLGKLAG